MLLAYAQMEEEIEVLASDLANYAMRRADEDVRVAKYQAMTGRLMSSFVELNAAGSFATPELMAIPDETFEASSPPAQSWSAIAAIFWISAAAAPMCSARPRRSCWPLQARWLRLRTISMVS